jgi:hypothetical protein
MRLVSAGDVCVFQIHFVNDDDSTGATWSIWMRLQKTRLASSSETETLNLTITRIVSQT